MGEILEFKKPKFKKAKPALVNKSILNYLLRQGFRLPRTLKIGSNHFGAIKIKEDISLEIVAHIDDTGVIDWFAIVELKGQELSGPIQDISLKNYVEIIKSLEL